MSAWSQIVARIVAQMQAVANIGAVYDRVRLFSSEDEFYALARVNVGGADRIRMWTVSLDTANPIQAVRDTHDGLVGWVRQVMIEGYFSLEDLGASEGSALALVEAVCDTLDRDARATKLGGTVLDAGPAGVITSEQRIFGIVLSHYIKIGFPVRTSEQR